MVSEADLAVECSLLAFCSRSEDALLGGDNMFSFSCDFCY